MLGRRYTTITEWLHNLPRRILNMMVAIILLVIFGLPMMVIATIIFIESPRSPVIFRQRRVGMDRRRFIEFSMTQRNRRMHNLGGKPFTMYKFRTMTHDPDRESAWAGSHQMHVTRFGQFLRSFRLDELPQLFNVLKGDMNVVGPRPEQIDIVPELARLITGYNVRHFVLPGITGLAQVSLRYDSDLEDVENKIQLDLKYVEKAGVFMDLYIMGMTPLVMILKKGSV